MKASTINIETILKKTVGRKLHTYDTWNGSSMTITVESAEQQSDGVLFTGTNPWGGKSGIYVYNEFVKQLVAKGKAEKHNEVDHCDVRTDWTLN